MKQLYINCYNNLIEREKAQYIKDVGNDDNWCDSYAEEDMNADEIVGYYLVWHEENALKQWLDNTRNKKETWISREVTNKLKRIFLFTNDK